jgi:hypothetical protein
LISYDVSVVGLDRNNNERTKAKKQKEKKKKKGILRIAETGDCVYGPTVCIGYPTLQPIPSNPIQSNPIQRIESRARVN